MKRAAFYTALLFAASASLFYLSGDFITVPLAVIFLFTAVMFFIFHKRLKIHLSAVYVFLISAVFCLFLFCYGKFYSKPVTFTDGKTDSIVCEVVSEPENSSGYTVLELKVKSAKNYQRYIKGKRIKAVLNKGDEISDLSVGSIISTDAVFESVDPLYKASNYSKGVFMNAKLKNTEISGKVYDFNVFCADIRSFVKSAVDDNFSDDNAALIKGIVLGDTSDMSDELYSRFKASGITHITAVSGMHISIVVMALFYLLRRIFGFRLSSPFTIVFLFLMVAVTGFSPSAVRAGFMYLVLLISYLLLWKSDSLNSLGIAVAVMLTVSPYSIVSLGFQLSCMATLGVILSVPYCNKASVLIGKRIKNGLLSLLICDASSVFIQSIGAVLFTLPIQIICFGRLSVVSPIVCVLITSAVSFALLLAVLGICLYVIPFGNYVAIVPFAVADVFISFIIIIVKVFSSFSFSYVSFGTYGAYIFVAVSLVIIGITVLLKFRHKYLIASGLIFAFLLVVLFGERFLNEHKLKAAVLNVGDGCSTVIINGTDAVILGFGDDKSDRYIIDSYLTKNGVTEYFAALPFESKLLSGAVGHYSERLTDNDALSGVSSKFDIEFSECEAGVIYNIYTENGSVSVIFCRYGFDIENNTSDCIINTVGNSFSESYISFCGRDYSSSDGNKTLIINKNKAHITAEEKMY